MPDDELTALARAMLRARKTREDYVSRDMLRGEQLWDLLLVLFIADGKGTRLTGRTVIERDGGSVETGRRWLMYLTRIRYIVGDGVGDLDDPLTLTPTGLQVLEIWLREALESFRGVAAISRG